jgi:hypothetical protein
VPVVLVLLFFSQVVKARVALLEPALMPGSL